MASRRAAPVDRNPPQDAEARGRPAASGGSRLDFYEALADFRRMFPSMGDEVIEAVLRANDGMVEATIDQLLAMSVDAAAPQTSSSSPQVNYREDHGDHRLATTSVLHADAPGQQRRGNSPTSLAPLATPARLPSTLLPLGAFEDGDFSDLMQQLPTSNRSVSPSLVAAAADASLTSAATAAGACVTTTLATPALGTSLLLLLQQELTSSQQFQDPFADLFAESAQPKRDSESVSSSLEQQSGSGETAANQQRPDAAPEPGRPQASPWDVQTTAGAPLAAPAIVRARDDGSPAAAGLPQPLPSGSSANRPPKPPLGISLSLPLAAASSPRVSPDLSPSSSLAIEGVDRQVLKGRREREHSSSDSLRLSPSAAAKQAAGDGRCSLTLPGGSATFADTSLSAQSTRESGGGAAAIGASGATGRSSPQPRVAQLSPSSAGIHYSSSAAGSSDLSPGEIVDLLERDDEPPPTLPPPRLRGSAGKSGSGREQKRQQSSASSGFAAAVSTDAAGNGSDCLGAVSPKVQAAAARWSVPLIGPLPYHFLRLCDDDQLPPPPRPPKPPGKLSLLGHDDAVAAVCSSSSMKPTLPSHAHHDGQQKVLPSRSRSQRNALIIGSIIADREGRDQHDSAPAASLEPGVRAKGRSSTLSSRQHISGDGGAGAEERPCGGESVPKLKHRRRVPGERLSTNEMKMRIAENERRIKETCDLEDLDEETVRYLEDERLALIMQNEEFLREVKRNEDFMRTLEFEQQLLEARLTADKSRRLAAAQSRAAARTLDTFARRSSEADSSAAITLTLQQPATAAAAGGLSSLSPPAAAADSPRGLRAATSSRSPAATLSTSPDPKLSTEASSSSSSSIHSSRSWASERIPMPSVASGSGGGGSSGSASSGGGTQSNSGSAESPTATSKAEASSGGEVASADFRRQLQTMGTSSKKKFAVLAKNFFTRKVRRAHHSHNPAAGSLSRTPLGPSMLNLLDDCDDEDVEFEEDNDANTCHAASSTSAPPAAAAHHRTAYDY